MDVNEGLQFLGISATEAEFWVCANCGNAGIMGPIGGDFGALETATEEEGDEPESWIDEPRDPLLTLLYESEIAYRSGMDPGEVLAMKPDLLSRQTGSFYDAASFTMGTHLLAETWRLRGARDSIDKLVRLIARRSATRLSTSDIAGSPGPERLSRCLTAWLDDARGEFLTDGELGAIGVAADAIPGEYSGAVEWPASNPDDALAITSANVVLHCEGRDMYEALQQRLSIRL